MTENKKNKWKTRFWFSLIVILALFISSVITMSFMKPEEEITVIITYDQEPTLLERIAELLFAIEMIISILTVFFTFYALGRSHNDRK